MVLFLGVIGLAGVVLWLYCLFDVITTPRQDVRTLPKLSWIAIVVLFLVFGAIAWLLTGRPRTEAVSSASTARPAPPGHAAAGPDRDQRGQRPPVGPDDDPEFMRRLDGRNDEEDGDDRGDPQQ